MPMNGNTPAAREREQPAAHRGVQKSQSMSQALLQGAQEISALFDSRVASLKAGYEERIRALIEERDALLAGPGANTVDNGEAAEELGVLRQERDRWKEDREQWVRTQAQLLLERAGLDSERKRLLEERERLMMELDGMRLERLGWLAQRAALQAQCESIKAEYEQKLQELAAQKDARIEDLESRVRMLEAAQNGPQAQPDQSQSKSLDAFESAPSPPAFPAMSSTLGTLTNTPLKSPSLEDMQVDDDGPPTQSPPKSPTVTLRLGQSPPKSPTVTLRLGQSSPKSPTNAVRVAQSPSVARSPTMLSTTAASHSMSTSEPRRLVIRVPPPTGKVRKPIKPPVSPLTEEERKLIVHVPLSQDKSDAGSPAKSSTTSESSSTSSSGLFSSP